VSDALALRLTKRRIVLNAGKKKHKPLYDALAAEQALRPAKELYNSGCTGTEDCFLLK
jgi:hypothetical protein